MKALKKKNGFFQRKGKIPGTYSRHDHDALGGKSAVKDFLYFFSIFLGQKRERSIDDEDDIVDYEILPGSPAKVAKIDNSRDEDVELFNFQISKWMPWYSMCPWKDEERNEKILLWILLPSGVGEHKTCKVKVVDDGKNLKVSVVWPKMMTDAGRLHQYFWDNEMEDLPEFHPKFIACKAAIEDMLQQLNF